MISQVLLCNGVCISGPDWASGLYTAGLILVAGVLHIVFVVLNLDNELDTIAFVVVSSGLLAVSLFLLLRVSESVISVTFYS